jgi:hypothetical protein
MRRIILILPLLLLCVPALAQVTKGTAVSGRKDPAGTQLVISSWTAGANALVVCGIHYDDNGTSTVVNSVSVSGSPSYSTAWAQLATNGREFTANVLGTELWWAVTSSGFTAQSVTIDISSSERFAAECQSYTGIDTANPIPASAKASSTAGSTPSVTVTSSGNDNSLYVGVIGCGTNSARTITAGTGYTVDADQFQNAINKWVHGALETKNAAVSPAANTTVDATMSGACTSGRWQIIAAEIKKAAGGGGGATPACTLATMGAGSC